MKQGEKEFDPYAEPIAVDQPVEFLKGERVVQKLRTVEAYVVDEQGNRIMPEKPWEEQPIRTAQLWRLVKDAPGMAEMSAILGDMVNAVEGDMVIDPSTVFNPSYQDTRISKTCVTLKNSC